MTVAIGCDALLRQTGEGSLTCSSRIARHPHHEGSEISSPQKGGLFLGFFDEVDAAFGARGDWRRDPDGDDGDAGDVSSRNSVFATRLGAAPHFRR